jgi:signal transduction histidine kinase
LPNGIFIELDRLRFRQVLSNIISKAIKNTPEKGIIFINLAEKDKNVDIQIRNTGVGLIKEEKEKLIEKFGKIKQYGMNLDFDVEGSGLGLYISKAIVELHDGQIFVESEGKNRGSAYIIRLPKN